MLACGVLCTAADAYVLHGLHLLDLMAAAMGRAESLQVKQKLIIHGSDPGSEHYEFEERLSFLFPSR